MQPITIRFPDEVASEVRELAKTSGRPINDLVVGAVSDALERDRADQALGRMARRIDTMHAEGRHDPPSEQLIRDLRSGSGRRG